MANPNITSLNYIIDRSGSMNHLKPETVGAFNKLLEDQKKMPGEVIFSLTLFDDKVVALHDSIPLKDVPPLTEETYWEGGGGWTALRDAVGMTTQRVWDRIAALPDAVKPGKVLFTIITDGEENKSTEYDPKKLLALVEMARKEWQFEFTMIGANINSMTTATNMGFSASNAINFNAQKGGMNQAIRAASIGTRAYRSQGGSSVQSFYTASCNVADLSADDSVLEAQMFASMTSTGTPVPSVIVTPSLILPIDPNMVVKDK